MKVIIDENISNEIKKLLAKAKIDVLDLKEKRYRQLPDQKILEIAIKQKRIIVTHDRDFLPFMIDSACKSKIVLLSIKPQTEEKMIAVAKFLITSEVLSKITKSAIVYYHTEEITFSSV